MSQAVEAYSRWLQETPLPKLLFHAQPGGILPPAMIDWCRQKMQNLHTVDIGPGIHYLQEDNPHLIGAELAKWYKALRG